MSFENTEIVWNPEKTGRMWKPELVKELLGGQFPYSEGFAWECVSHFRLEYGILEPYNSFDEILPAPGIIITAKEDKNFFDSIHIPPQNYRKFPNNINKIWRSL